MKKDLDIDKRIHSPEMIGKQRGQQKRDVEKKSGYCQEAEVVSKAVFFKTGTKQLMNVGLSMGAKSLGHMPIAETEH